MAPGPCEFLTVFGGEGARALRMGKAERADYPKTVRWLFSAYFCPSPSFLQAGNRHRDKPIRERQSSLNPAPRGVPEETALEIDG